MGRAKLSWISWFASTQGVKGFNFLAGTIGFRFLPHSVHALLSWILLSKSLLQNGLQRDLPTYPNFRGE